MTDLLWPRYSNPGDLTAIDAPPMTSHSDESPEDFPVRIEAAMHARLNELVTNRKPIIG